MFTLMRGALFAVKALDETVLQGLAKRDVIPIDARIVNLFEDCLSGKVCAPSRQICHADRLPGKGYPTQSYWHAALSDPAVQFLGNALTGQRCVRDQHQVVATEIGSDRKNTTSATIHCPAVDKHYQ